MGHDAIGQALGAHHPPVVQHARDQTNVPIGPRLRATPSRNAALLSRRFLERPLLSLKRYLSDGTIRVRGAPVTEARAG